jgi:hypothetical protein
MNDGKPHIEFSGVDMAEGWHRPPGYPDGFEQKILVCDIDEKNKSGSRSRLMRLTPGTFSTKPFVHNHSEEVYLVEGDLVVGNNEKGEGGTQFFAPTYACRPPGIWHGPFASRTGCLMFELHYYEPERASGV